MSKRRRSSDEDAALWQELCCPITHDIMRDPVVAADGHSYERAAISCWLWTGKRTSPVTNLPMSSVVLVPNHSLRRVARLHTGLHPGEAADTSYDARMMVELAQRLGTGTPFRALFTGATAQEVVDVICSRASLVEPHVAAAALGGLVRQTMVAGVHPLVATEAAVAVLVRRPFSSEADALSSLRTVSRRPKFFEAHLQHVVPAILDAAQQSVTVRAAANAALLDVLRSCRVGRLAPEGVHLIVAYMTEAPDVASALMAHCDKAVTRCGTLTPMCTT